MDILNAYHELGSYRAAAALCGTTHKTVRRVVARRLRPPPERPPRPKKTDPLRELIADKVRLTDGRISAKRVLPHCRAAGYDGSARTLRRAVAEAKAAWRRQRRTYRPWLPVPGEHLVLDWGATAARRHVFCAVLAWSRWRFVRFADDERQATTLRLLAECFETLGGVPAVVLADRMACLKGGVVANVVVPAPAYVAFAAYYGFRPDFCEAADPESKGLVEHLVGYAKADLVAGLGPWATTEEANEAAAAWCAEVNGQLHSEIAAVPAERLATERALLRRLPSLGPARGTVQTRKVDGLRTVRYGSARYSVPGTFIGRRVDVAVGAGELAVFASGAEIARHRLVGPGEVSLRDEHYGRPPRAPVRAIRPRTAAELAFLGLGAVAEAFLRQAAAAGTSRLAAELAELADLERAHGREAIVAALERALAFRRFRATDVRSILAAGAGVPRVTRPGEQLAIELPSVPVRALADYATEGVP